MYNAVKNYFRCVGSHMTYKAYKNYSKIHCGPDLLLCPKFCTENGNIDRNIIRIVEIRFFIFFF
jgi:hypothetical protein